MNLKKIIILFLISFFLQNCTNSESKIVSNYKDKKNDLIKIYDFLNKKEPIRLTINNNVSSLVLDIHFYKYDHNYKPVYRFSKSKISFNDLPKYEKELMIIGWTTNEIIEIVKLISEANCYSIEKQPIPIYQENKENMNCVAIGYIDEVTRGYSYFVFPNDFTEDKIDQITILGEKMSSLDNRIGWIIIK